MRNCTRLGPRAITALRAALAVTTIDVDPRKARGKKRNIISLRYLEVFLQFPTHTFSISSMILHYSYNNDGISQIPQLIRQPPAKTVANHETISF
jgi:hypothetical protein